MCKYCEFTYVGDSEKSNDVKHIKTIRDGSQISDVSLYRYHADYGYNLNELILETAVVLSDGVHTVREEHVKIEYCPFCGEKL